MLRYNVTWYFAPLAGQVRASVAGLLVSYIALVPAGPAVVITAGVLWRANLAIGPHASLWRSGRQAV